MEGPPLGPGGEDITWPDQVAPRGRKASSTPKIKPQTSNLWVPALTWGTSLPSCLSAPWCPLPSPCPCPSPIPGVLVAGGAGWGGGADGPGLGVGGLEPLAEGPGGVGGAEALDRIAEEGLPCRLRHNGLRGEGMHHVHPILPSRSPGPLHPAAELLQSGGRPPGEVGRGLGEGGVRARGPGAAGGGRGPVVVVGVAVPWGAGAAVAGAGGGGRVRAEGGTRGGGGHGAAMARLMASGGAGVVVARAGNGGWVWAAGGTGSPAGPVWGGGGGRGAGLACLAGPGGAGAVVAGAGVGVLYGRRGEGEVDMGRQWRSWWRPGERKGRGRGPGGSWWHLGVRERREWVVEARWRCGEFRRRGRVCHAGGERERCCLRDRASSLESGQSGGVGGSWGASRGAAWYWGGGGGCLPWIRHVGVWWWQRLVVWVD